MPDKRDRSDALHDLKKKLTDIRDAFPQADSINSLTESDVFDLLTKIKRITGNTGNDMSTIACLMAHDFLVSHFPGLHYDPLARPMGANGHDIKETLPNDEIIVGEIKTTTPCEAGCKFGAQQRKMILEDLRKLNNAEADHRFFFLTDQAAFDAVSKFKELALPAGIKVVKLPEGVEMRANRADG